MGKASGTSGYDGGARVRDKMLALLADGQPRTLAQLRACLWDDQAAVATVRFHISTLRRALRADGYDIAAVVYQGNRCYRMVRVLASPYDGKR